MSKQPAKIKAQPKRKLFVLNDLLKSATAERLKISNEPSAHHEKNLLVMLRFLNILKLEAKQDFQITSCYRSPQLNKTVGGAKNSFHLAGLACDITCRDLEDFEKDIKTLFEKNKIGKNLWIKIYKERNFLHFQFSLT